MVLDLPSVYTSKVEYKPCATSTMTTTQQLYEKLQLLKTRFASLPESIPESTGDTSQFFIDPEDILNMGTSRALNKVFHWMWGYKDRGIRITSRRSQVSTTLRLLKETIPVADDHSIIGLWIDALDKAAEAAGGSVIQSGAGETTDYSLVCQDPSQQVPRTGPEPRRENTRGARVRTHTSFGGDS